MVVLIEATAEKVVSLIPRVPQTKDSFGEKVVFYLKGIVV